MRTFILAYQPTDARELAHRLCIPPNLYVHLHNPDQLRGLPKGSVTVLIHPTATRLKKSVRDEIDLIMRDCRCQVYMMVDLTDEWMRAAAAQAELKRGPPR